ALRAVLPRRIRQHDRRLVGGDDAVPGRVAAAVSERRGAVVPRPRPRVVLVPREDVRLSLHFPVGARDAAALSLRPADAPRMESADPARHLERGDHRDPQGGSVGGGVTAATITFYALGAIILIFALLVVTARNTVYSILFLVVDFLAVA